MAVELGLTKTTVFAKQSGLGVLATTGGQVTRRTSSVFDKTSQTYENNEIVSHQQSTGATEGVRQTSGKLDGLLSPGTYSLQFGSLLRQNFASVSAITGASITIAGSGPTFTLTRATGSFLTDGIKIGHVFKLTAGSFNAANLGVNLLVIGVTATVLTVITLNGSTLVAEGPISAATLTVPGKVSFAPPTGQTNDYWSVEEFYTVNGKSELFGDVKISKAAISLPATGNSTVSFDCPGLSRNEATSQQITSPTAATTTNVLTAVNGRVLVNGAVTPITGGTLTIDGQIQPGQPEVGSNQISDHVRGSIKVSGQITAKFTTTTLRDLRNNQTVVSLILGVTDTNSAAADFIVFTMPAVKLFTDTPDDGDAKEIIRTYNFTAQYNGTGGAGAATNQTICQMQDSQAS